MHAISACFANNLDVVYFIYGTAFAFMGMIVILQPRKDSGFPLVGSFFLLGCFGLSHSISEFLEMWVIIKRPEHIALGAMRLGILAASYAFLFEAGRRIVRAEGAGCSLTLARTARLLRWQILPILLLLTGGLAACSHSFIQNATILSRYLIGFTGALLAGTGLLNFYRCKAPELQSLKARNYFMLSGVTFIAYGLLGGLVTRKAGFFPANLLNSEAFFTLTGLPVELFRAICAVLISWGIIGIVRIFNWERDEMIQGVVFNNSEDCIASISLEGRLLAVNKTCLRSYEFDGPWELIGKNAADIISVNAQKLSDSILRAAHGGFSALQYDSIGKKGGKLSWDAVVSPVTGVDDKIKSVICVAKNITEQLAAREKIRRNQEAQSVINDILSLAVENVSVENILERVLDRILSIDWLGIQKQGAIMLLDASGKFLTMTAQRGLSGPIAQACANVPLGRCLCGRAALSGETVFAEGVDERHEIGYDGMKPHGHYCLPIKVRNRTLGVLNVYLPAGHAQAESERNFLEAVCSILAKMLEYKNLQARAHQIQKMESLGRFAGAMAHDFNNILTGIKGFNELALEAAQDEPRLRGYLKETASGIDKGAGLIKQVLTFSRNQPAEMSVLDLNAVITELEPMLGMVLTKRIKLKLSLAPGLPLITGNKNQLVQILVNLAVNSRDAMPGGGEFSITSMAFGPGTGGRCTADFNPAVKGAKVSVSDTGCGIPQELLERVFEPFFTTKPEGKGTGLGLSTVYSLVKLHGGGIGITSRKNQGTNFDICFPEALPGTEQQAGGRP